MEEQEAGVALSVSGAQLRLGDKHSGRQVLKGVDLQIRKGELLALLGGSGCGKTTLLRVIAGLAGLDQGVVCISGRDVTRLTPQQRGVGVVFQHYALFPNLSVRENIKFGVLAEGHSQAEAEARAAELLELVELQAHAQKLPGQLSGGQRQRVALARALARKPSLLLMDEPFSALDESFRVPLRRSFRRLQQSLGQTCLVVTHDREEAFELADQVAVMFDGRIEQCSAPLTLWQRPATRRVADFLGAFNQFDARQLAEPLRRDGGSWIAPIAALRPQDLAPGSGEHCVLRAQVEACYIGQQRISVQLRGEGGESLQLWREHHEPLPAVGDWLQLGLPLAAMQYLAD
ncbi:ATP-binding cassette domain-containing protein [Paucibacter sp. APW11]|uniref:ATP-binding cassette domain-containing protein n=1 Tax=Roseateles aquae TaxID=3077235 RepID=A0ABU3PEX2_9BURK|nr:ATP-binding cassette domain-containing protein [Paucibacter sp. APW11]MDT9001142.1 ATP-binding cassette domain-containing protein [Paucibacter sp. APW11]